MSQKTMEVVGIKKFGDLSQVCIMKGLRTDPSAHEIEIKIAYAGANPVDWKVVAGLVPLPNNDFPIILGWEFAGTVSKVGKDVTTFREGDFVFGCTRSCRGTFAEYGCFDAAEVVKKPKHLNMAVSSSLPLVSLTAWQALETFRLKKGQTILIHAGAGGVGSMAIQIAKYFGATVITTAQEKNYTYVKQLGATYVIDYTKGSFINQVKALFPKDLDAAFDCVGGKVLEDSFSLIKQGGSLVSIVEKPDPNLARKHNISTKHFHFRPDQKQLQTIKELLEKEILIPLPIEEFPLAQARQALEKIKLGHVRGKIVIKIDQGRDE